MNQSNGGLGEIFLILLLDAILIAIFVITYAIEEAFAVLLLLLGLLALRYILAYRKKVLQEIWNKDRKRLVKVTFWSTVVFFGSGFPMAYQIKNSMEVKIDIDRLVMHKSSFKEKAKILKASSEFQDEICPKLKKLQYTIVFYPSRSKEYIVLCN